MVSQSANGKVKVGGDAEEAPCLGSLLGLWWPSWITVLIIGLLIFYFVGYASVTTMSVGLTSTFVLALRAPNLDAHWAYAIYGVAAEILLIISLRPNFQRLIEGKERLHGFRTKRMNRS